MVLYWTQLLPPTSRKAKFKMTTPPPVAPATPPAVAAPAIAPRDIIVKRLPIPDLGALPDQVQQLRGEIEKMLADFNCTEVRGGARGYTHATLGSEQEVLNALLKFDGSTQTFLGQPVKIKVRRARVRRTRGPAIASPQTPTPPAAAPATQAPAAPPVVITPPAPAPKATAPAPRTPPAAPAPPARSHRPAVANISEKTEIKVLVPRDPNKAKRFPVVFNTLRNNTPASLEFALTSTTPFSVRLSPKGQKASWKTTSQTLKSDRNGQVRVEIGFDTRAKQIAITALGRSGEDIRFFLAR